jgi:predicted MPP superfamily phosphohydrolase
VRNFDWRRRAWERIQSIATSSGWPGSLARSLFGVPEIDVRSYEIPLLHPPAARPLRIAFAADFHAGPTTTPEILEAACKLLASSSPDVLLLGGDFVTLNAHYIDPLIELLGAIHAPLGRFAVLGNHDLWVDFQYIERRLDHAGIHILTNQNSRLAPPFHDVWICGLDDHWSGSPVAESAFAGAEGIRILLMHQPSGLLDLHGERFDLAFCGHTHGGQIALPGGRPIVVPQGMLSRRYAGGRYDIPDGGTLIVSRGVGCTTLPFRLNSVPDIVSCTLTPSLAT